MHGSPLWIATWRLPNDRRCHRDRDGLSPPVDRVRRALTTREALATWLMPNDFAPEVGRGFAFRVEAQHGWTLYTHDLTRLQAFYTDLLGMEVVPQLTGPNFMFLRSAGIGTICAAVAQGRSLHLEAT